MSKERFLTLEDIKQNIQKLKSFMRSNKLDSFYISSSDIFLNEYVPLPDCHRYYVTNFTGSTAEVIVPLNGEVILFVDGRYYEQADIEADPAIVEVYKCPYGMGLQTAMKEIIRERGLKNLGVEGDRIDISLFKEFSNLINVKSFNNAELTRVIDFKEITFDKLIRELPLDLVGETTLAKCQRLLNPGEAFFITALDSIAWITNLRRFEMPFQSTFRAKALATRDNVYLLLENIEGVVQCLEIEISVGKFSELENFLDLVTEYETTWKKFLGAETQKIEKVFYSDRSLNAADFQKLKKHFGEDILVNRSEGLVPLHASKNPAELKSMENSFNRGDQAIFETITWIKEQVKNGVHLTELDFFHKTNEFYKNNGALELSFKTISAVGANSSIIHFSNPSADVVIKEDELLLLDSGGYFESGYATDTTRTFLSGGSASNRQKEIYTLVLKSILHAQNAVFPEGTWGSVIDGVARQPVFKHGLNYNHGTGHGVGINVHEGGYRISTTSTVPLKENTVGSLEPGIYIPGFGGVRLENIMAIEKDPAINGMLHFRSLVLIGFDHDLINESMLSAEEIAWLETYERECQARGRSFKYRS
ncbi:MAG: M24 family metallopeptidase [Bacteriovorax sp.]|nr:M24 family metallopeptidase [Bacteriovorax sp.]